VTLSLKNESTDVRQVEKLFGQKLPNPGNTN